MTTPHHAAYDPIHQAVTSPPVGGGTVPWSFPLAHWLSHQSLAMRAVSAIEISKKTAAKTITPPKYRDAWPKYV
eukprot:gene15855-37812_t